MRIRDNYNIKRIKLDDIYLTNIRHSKSLSESIDLVGNRRRILVAPAENFPDIQTNGQNYVIIDGRSRVTSMKQAGEEEIIAEIDNTIHGQKELSITALLSNSGSPNRWDEACHVENLYENGMTIQEIADMVNVSHTKIADRLRIARNIIDDLKPKLASGEVNVSVAAAASRLPKDMQQELYNEDKLTAKRCHELAKEIKNKGMVKLFETFENDPDVKPGYFIEPEIMEQLSEGDSIEIEWDGKKYSLSAV